MIGRTLGLVVPRALKVASPRAGVALYLSAATRHLSYRRADGEVVDLEAAGGGSGDVVGPSSSVASEVALYDGTTGKLLKRAAISGLAKLASGVLSAAAAGTDYYAPGSTDVAVADGGTGSSTALGARQSLGLDPLLVVRAHGYISTSGFGQVGGGGMTNTGVALGVDATSRYVSARTTSTSGAGWYTPADWYSSLSPTFRLRFRTPSDLTSMRRYIGYMSSAGTILTSDTISGRAAACIRYSSVAGDTTFQLITCDATNPQTVTDTTVTITADHEYELTLYSDDAGVTWRVTLRDLTAATSASCSTTSTVPVTSTAMSATVQGNSTGAGVTRDWPCRSWTVETSPLAA